PGTRRVKRHRLRGPLPPRPSRGLLCRGSRPPARGVARGLVARSRSPLRRGPGERCGAGHAVAFCDRTLASRGPAAGKRMVRMVPGRTPPRGARGRRRAPRILPWGCDACRGARQGGGRCAAARPHPSQRHLALDRSRPVRHDVLRGRNILGPDLSGKPDVCPPPSGAPGNAGPGAGDGPAGLHSPRGLLAAAWRAIGVRHDAIGCALDLSLGSRSRDGPGMVFPRTRRRIPGAAGGHRGTAGRIPGHAHPCAGRERIRPLRRSPRLPRRAMGRMQTGPCFAIAAADAGCETQIGDDGLLYADGRSRGQPCLVLRTAKVSRFGVILCGTLDGTGLLPAAVEAARSEWRAGCEPAAPPPAPVRLPLSPSPRKPRDRDGLAPAVARLDEMLPWLAHNATIHFSAPHGLEQQGGAAWGVRDVCQGSAEWLLAEREWPIARRMLETVFSQQYVRDGSWPQWFMHPPYRSIQQTHSHGDVLFWPLKALCDYIEASNDLAFLGWRTGYTDPESFGPVGPEETLLQHCDRVVDQCEARFVPGTALVNYGDGDWDDTLQPADPAMRTRMISAWTVELSYQTFRQLAEVLRRASEPARLARLEMVLARMRRDFADRLMPGSVVAGFLVAEADGTTRPLLHPSDAVTGIRYRLLPMTRSILAELFTLEEAARHMAIVNQELLYPDGARLMSEPTTYGGGMERLFKRADTAANVGREIGLQYVHAHLRYAEAAAKHGDADRLWTALQVVNPVGLREVVPHAMARQSNVYFSSSDADFHDRVEAALRWKELRTGSVRVRGGWRLP